MKKLISLCALLGIFMISYGQQHKKQPMADPRIGDFKTLSTVTLKEIFDADSIYIYDLNNNQNYKVESYKIKIIRENSNYINSCKCDKIVFRDEIKKGKTIIFFEIKYILPDGKTANCPKLYTLNISDNQ